LPKTNASKFILRPCSGLRKKTIKMDGKRKPVFTLAEIAELCECSRSYVKQVVAKAREEGKL
jgi:MarR-like DNA-binding transcriptional regulator SgrR of sgrS sRNA